MIPCSKRIRGKSCGKPSVEFHFVERPDYILEQARKLGREIPAIWPISHCEEHKTGGASMTEDEFAIFLVMTA
jgi:hypothetical protein